MRWNGCGARALVVLAALAGACGDDGSATPDGGVDGGGDVVDAGRDGGPLCEPGCLFPDSCCPAASAELGICVDTRNDLTHCGGCDVVCGERFTECDRGRCICGETPCLAPNECCPGPTEGSAPRCRALDTVDDCGACGVTCDRDVASRCAGGECVCGGVGRACDAEAGETCCFEVVPPLPTSARLCADLRSDRRHCGACGRRCPAGADCVDGTCSYGTTVCEADCLIEQVCCDGTCCLDRQCDGSTCSFSRTP